MRGVGSLSLITQLAREGHFEDFVGLHTSTVRVQSDYVHRMR